MTQRILIINLLMALSLAPMMAQAAEPLPLHAAFSGVLVSTPCDSNGGGAPANFRTQQGQSTLGPLSLQGLDDSMSAELDIGLQGANSFVRSLGLSSLT